MKIIASILLALLLLLGAGYVQDTISDAKITAKTKERKLAMKAEFDAQMAKLEQESRTAAIRESNDLARQIIAGQEEARAAAEEAGARAAEAEQAALEAETRQIDAEARADARRRGRENYEAAMEGLRQATEKPKRTAEDVRHEEMLNAINNLQNEVYDSRGR
jgi:hypothetical protein